jgi:hypothetical protein
LPRRHCQEKGIELKLGEGIAKARSGNHDRGQEMAPEDVSRLVSGIGRKCIDVAATPSGRRLGDVWGYGGGSGVKEGWIKRETRTRGSEGDKRSRG